ncbi:glycosyltransferase family 4 protein [Bacillus timonensis]|uniref:glycosyltransferase family 4 protein n=1 Tax=Bacillus timonensis TaxID=1033734 RepID=UPI00028991CA|nr:glycosyltransferase family 4 protein [Bacillus timonensis]
MTGLIEKLRINEYISRANRVNKINKQIVDKVEVNSTIKEDIHVVYVMNHVGVCGGTKIIFEHANGLTELGVTVTILSHFAKPDWFPIKANYVFVPFQIEITRFIPQCDLIIATYWEHIGACVEMGVAPVIYFEQGDFHLFDWDILDGEKKDIIYSNFQLPYKIMAVSSQISKLIKKNFNRDSDVVHNALNNEIFYPKSKIVSDKKYMLIVGSEHSEFKGIKDLKESYLKVKDRGYNIELLWITQTEPIEKLGEVYVNPPQKVIGEIYRKADFYVCGSYYESFPLPSLEAMSCGIPVITTDNTGINEYAINNYNCLMTAPGNVPEMVEQIIKLLEDDELYTRLKLNGIKTSEDYKWENILSDLLIYYREVASHKLTKKYTLNEWEKNYTISELANINDEELINSFLVNTNADEIQLLREINVIQGLSIYRWESLVKRKNINGNGIVEKLNVKLKQGIEDNQFYSEGLLYFKNKNFQEALKFFNKKLGSLPIGSNEHAVCLRWVALCLYELNFDNSLMELLVEAIKEYPYYTDLLYIYGILLIEKGNQVIGEQLLGQVMLMQDAYSFPEFIGDINNVLLNHFNVL